MIHSKSVQYAIRAMIMLGTQTEGVLCRLEDIAANESIPQQFLAKIMQRLTKRRLVRSSKGKGGGFTLLLPADRISLYSIVDAIDDLSLTLGDCILGKGNCNQEDSCPLHDAWKQLRERQVQFLQSITIADMANSGGLET